MPISLLQIILKKLIQGSPIWVQEEALASDQMHRITELLGKAFEEKESYVRLFIPLYKTRKQIRTTITKPICITTKLICNNGSFRMKQGQS